MFGGFEIEFFDPVTLDDRNTGFFPVARIDEHTHCHYKFSGRVALSGAAPLVRTKSWLRTRAPVSSGLMVSSCLRDDHVRAMVPEKTLSATLRPQVGAKKQKSESHESFERQPVDCRNTAQPDKHRPDGFPPVM